MIEQWTPISLLIFLGVIVILVYAIGVFAGTVLKEELDKDKIKAAQKLAEEKKPRRR
jgi:Na+-transporting methylmalonyl-CoA/oxaloacetate decarboxylase gamma subunit